MWDTPWLLGFDGGQWAMGAGAALLVGLSKTGMPGLGLLSVPMMAVAFGPRLSVGALLPMLIAADAFAVAWFRRHCRWTDLVKLAPWVAVGIALGAIGLWLIGESHTKKDLMGGLIGGLILIMLILYVLNLRLGSRYSVRFKSGVAACGTAAGFTTTVANAAGPVMTIYLSGAGLDKEQFIGTGAWYFFIVNLTKLPILALLTYWNPAEPLLTTHTLTFNMAMLPLIVCGAIAGRTLLSAIPQKAFEVLVLALAAGGGLKLLADAIQR